MALTVNEKQLVECVLAQEAYIAVWESVRPERDIPMLHGQRLADLAPAMEAARARVEDSIQAYKAQQ